MLLKEICQEKQSSEAKFICIPIKSKSEDKEYNETINDEQYLILDFSDK